MKKWVKEVMAYYQDNPEGYWFKRRLYGFGWTPVTREGWLVLLIFVLFMFLNVWRFENGGYPETEVFKQVLIPTMAAIVLLVFVSYKKGEPPKWQFGIPSTKTVMRLNTEPFKRIKNGQKKIEVRLYDKKRRLLRVGDKLEFILRNSQPEEKFEKRIVSLHKFNTFKELFESFPEEGSYSNMYQFYSPEDEKKYGVLAIELG